MTHDQLYHMGRHSDSRLIPLRPDGAIELLNRYVFRNFSLYLKSFESNHRRGTHDISRSFYENMAQSGSIRIKSVSFDS
jgi:hypothetical protein